MLDYFCFAIRVSAPVPRSVNNVPATANPTLVRRGQAQRADAAHERTGSRAEQDRGPKKSHREKKEAYEFFWHPICIGELKSKDEGHSRWQQSLSQPLAKEQDVKRSTCI
jgi:hypothetical protein